MSPVIPMSPSSPAPRRPGEVRSPDEAVHLGLSPAQRPGVACDVGQGLVAQSVRMGPDVWATGDPVA